MFISLPNLRVVVMRSFARTSLPLGLLLTALLAQQGCSTGTGDSPGAAGSFGAQGGSSGGVSGSGFGGSGVGGSGIGGSGAGSSGVGGSGVGGSGAGGSGVGGTSGVGGSGVGGSAVGGSGVGGSGVGGSGGSTAGGTGGTNTDGGVVGGGYITSGNWHGYAWTGVGGSASIDPPDYGNFTDFPLCASGQIQAGDTNVAMFGWNINQVQGVNPPVSTVAPANFAQGGIFVSITNPGNTPLRIQIEGAAGYPTEAWCAPITAGTNIFVPWTAFKTQCWSSTGTVAYTGTPLKSIEIMVPGTTSLRSFNFCVNDITEGTDPNTQISGGCSIAGDPAAVSGALNGSISDYLGWQYVNTNQSYIVQNNAWNPTSGMSQTISYIGRSFSVTTQTGNLGTTGAPVSFPSLFIGANNGRATSNSGMPKRVGDITSVPTGWSWSGNPSGQWNAAYDVWFSSSSAGDQGSSTRSFLMVWFGRTSGPRPEDDLNGPYTTAHIANVNWDVWYGTNVEGRPVISYVAQQTVNSLEFDLKNFIDHAKGAQGRPAQFTDNLYLTNIFSGFEIWSGGQGLKTNNFCASVQ